MLDTKGRRVHIGDGVKVLTNTIRKGKRKTLIGVVAMHCTDDLIGVMRDDRCDFVYAKDVAMLVRIANEPQCVCMADPRGRAWCQGSPLVKDGAQ
jgi:hypothetical protein